MVLYYKGNIDRDQTAAHLPLLEAAAGVTGQPGAHRPSENNTFKKKQVHAVNYLPSIKRFSFGFHITPNRRVLHTVLEVCDTSLRMFDKKKKQKMAYADTPKGAKKAEWGRWVGERLVIECGMCRHCGWKGSERGETERKSEANKSGWLWRASSATVLTGRWTARETKNMG